MEDRDRAEQLRPDVESGASRPSAPRHGRRRTCAAAIQRDVGCRSSLWSNSGPIALTTPARATYPRGSCRRADGRTGTGRGVSQRDHCRNLVKSRSQSSGRRRQELLAHVVRGPRGPSSAAGRDRAEGRRCVLATVLDRRRRGHPLTPSSICSVMPPHRPPMTGRSFQSPSLTVSPKPFAQRLLQHDVGHALECVDLDVADLLDVREQMRRRGSPARGACVWPAPNSGTLRGRRSPSIPPARAAPDGNSFLHHPVCLDDTDRIFPRIEAAYLSR